METNETNKEVLVLTDESGSYYAIPFEALERYRVTKEQKAEIEGLLGPDVSGYGMFEQYVTEHRASQYQADRQGEAERERLLKSTEEGAGGEGRSLPGRGFFTGVVTTLQSISRALPKQV
jgi:hypothetical protein